MKIDMTEYRQIEQYQVDAFTSTAFGGNPAAVVFSHKNEKWMKNVAAENNLAETAFLKLREGTSTDYDIRWYVLYVLLNLSCLKKMS